MRQGNEMHTKFVILAVISTLLVAAIYSSTTSVVFAAVSCIDASKTQKFCVTTTEPGNMYDCVKQDDGKWVCKKVPQESKIPSGLSDALEDVTAAKAPKTLNEAEEPEQPDSNNTFTRANISALE
jgi:hypothetical protein